jgi:hypothetical protein
MDEIKLRLIGLERLVLELLAEMPPEALERVVGRLREAQPLSADDALARDQAIALGGDAGRRFEALAADLRHKGEANDR